MNHWNNGIVKVRNREMTETVFPLLLQESAIQTLQISKFPTLQLSIS